MIIAPIAPVGVDPTALVPPLPQAPPMTTPAAGVSFGSLLMQGLDGVNQQLVESDAMVRAFALDDSLPLHQVTFALEQSRLSFELLMQVRGRLVEGYQEMMRMQL